jgi:hypothetical protein
VIIINLHPKKTSVKVVQYAEQHHSNVTTCKPKKKKEERISFFSVYEKVHFVNEFEFVVQMMDL